MVRSRVLLSAVAAALAVTLAGCDETAVYPGVGYGGPFYAGGYYGAPYYGGGYEQPAPYGGYYAPAPVYAYAPPVYAGPSIGLGFSFWGGGGGHHGGGHHGGGGHWR